MSASSTPLSTPEGPGSVSGAPNLPAGFTARARAVKPAADDVQTWSFPAPVTGWPSRPPRSSWRR
jgi:hypothetical protein